MNENHKSVLVREASQLWRSQKGGLYIDATLGAGGHSQALLQMDPDAKCLGIDRDRQAIEIAKKNLKDYKDRMSYFQGNYSQLAQAAQLHPAFRQVDGILADLGVSSMQLDSPERGFSFRKGGPIDMRMDSQGLTALDLIRNLSERDLERAIREYGEEKNSRRIARTLKKAEAEGRLTDTLSLAETIEGVQPKFSGAKIHPATRTFQGLRIAVNRELEHLEKFLSAAPSFLKKGGRLVVISFHSLEDRMVKQAFKKASRGCVCPPSFPQCVCGKRAEFRILTSKPAVATARETEDNPRSRSAKLRAMEKI